MHNLLKSPWLLAAGFAFAIAAIVPHSGQAAGDPPKPPCPKDKKKKNECRSDQTGDEQVYHLGYWQAKSGAYEAALSTLRTAQRQDDPRILTMIGFSLRKLGRVDEALVYYGRALAANPDLTTTRQYLGEAYLQIGQPENAKAQLVEIAKRCGVACEDYRLLAAEIAKAAAAG